MDIKKLLSKILPTIIAEAHCDVPCGIYDPTPAKIAAMTVLRMVLQIKDIHLPKDWNDGAAVASYMNSITRRIHTKEEHAAICKKELLILWSDFFKPEHLEHYPELHNHFWKAVKLCSKDKQEINEEAAKELIKEVDEVAKMFYETKNALDKYEAYKKITDTLF